MQYALPYRHIAGLGGHDYHGDGGGGGVVVTVTAVAAAAAAVIEGELIGFASAHYRYLDCGGYLWRSGILHLNVCCYIGSWFYHRLHCSAHWVYMHHSPYTAAIRNIYLLASIQLFLTGQAIAFKSDGGVRVRVCFLIPVTLDGHGVVSAESNIGHFEHIAFQHKQFFVLRRCLIIIVLKRLQVDLIVKFEGEYNFRPAVYLSCLLTPDTSAVPKEILLQVPPISFVFLLLRLYLLPATSGFPYS